MIDKILNWIILKSKSISIRIHTKCNLSNERIKKSYITFWQRPMYTHDIRYHRESYSSEKIAIVLQGPLLNQNDFTIETVKLYRKLYKKCPIIISTWDSEDEEKIAILKSIDNVCVIQSSAPKNAGITHINYQKTSSCAGIELSKKMGCKYVLKTRTDQRLYSGNNIEYFKKLVEFFPINLNCKANKRIVASSLSTIKNRLYNVCDMVLFGDVDDLLRYFSPPEAPVFIKGTQLPDEFLDPVGYAKSRAGEIFFTTHYIENCGFDLKWTFEDSDFYRNELFIIVDSEAIDQFWPKYSRKEYLWRDYYGKKYDLVGFKEWFLEQ